MYSTAAQEIRDSGLWDANNPSSSMDPYAAPGYPRGANHERQQSGLRNEYYVEDDAVEEKFYGGREERFDPPTQDYRGGYEGQGYEGDEREYQQHYAQQQGGQRYEDPYQQQQGYGHQQQQQGESWDPAYRR